MVSDRAHKHKRRTMKLKPANIVGPPQKLSTPEQAQVRIVILVLVSFLLGVVATAFWFHLTTKPDAEISSSQTAIEPDAGQPVEPAINVNRSPRPLVANPPPVDAAAIAEVKQAIPNFASVSLEDGTQILREAALKQFMATTKEMDAQVKQAEQQAKDSQSASEQETARKHLQQIQAAGTEKLQQIAARLQTQIAALQQLKGAAQ